MGEIGKILICLSICALEAACVQGEKDPVRISVSAATSEPITQGDSMIQGEMDPDENEGSVNENVQSEYQDDMDTEIGISDILIPESPYLSEVPFMAADLEHVLTYDPELEKVEGYDSGNGHFNYWKGIGIEYVTYFTDNDIVGMIINSSDYSLANRIRVGMTESELLQTGYPFEKYESETNSGRGAIVFGSGLLNDEIGPLNTIDYDHIYAYVGSASDDEVSYYEITGTICYSVVLLMKDDVVDTIVLDLPTAG